MWKVRSVYIVEWKNFRYISGEKCIVFVDFNGYLNF